MNIISIDVGYKNTAISIFKIYKNKIKVNIIKLDWSTNNYMTKLNKLTKYKKYTVIIERQYKGYKNIYLMGYLKGFFESLGYNVKIILPFTHGMKIESYKERKMLSTQIFLLYTSKYDFKNFKIDDMADSFCLGLSYISKDIVSVVRDYIISVGINEI